jgi:hypothetical protein
MYATLALERKSDYRIPGASTISTRPRVQYKTATPDYVSRYEHHKSAWELETANSSFVRDKIASPHFRAIVAMGDLVIPLIVRDIRLTPSFLFLALGEITGENPVPPAAAGRVGEMIDAWLSWANRRLGNAD